MTASMQDERDIASAPVVAFGAAFLLAVLAAYNFSTGVYGGAIVSGVGVMIATLFGLLTE
ncbi:hypothetical protein halTADL_1099 [Halohasta litchfieldiae]|jgi:hypothetical protein|uniref:Uncharacterized protein n=1 Tax=Halohasta litchfieldiae TaxID=1073996 RepID=A0A1H6SA40_9EURY|nr:hypothetical protein [Halohasta litchfieldiae]ATW87892.1 hypothetical protein halTADL_1099 [Halohasta litchfieldiae]SEI62774.1 hypothetical protein SAMN05444271_10497 [Halohasta litchfieldiae]